MPYVDPATQGSERVVVGRNSNGDVINACYTDSRYESFTEIGASDFSISAGGGEAGGVSEPEGASGNIAPIGGVGGGGVDHES
jgi:hypothetical protein